MFGVNDLEGRTSKAARAQPRIGEGITIKKLALLGFSLLGLGAAILGITSRSQPEKELFTWLVLYRLGNVLEARVDTVSGLYEIQAGIAGGEGVCYPAIKYVGQGEFLIDGEFRRSTVPYAFVVLNETGFLGGGYGADKPQPFERHGCSPRE